MKLERAFSLCSVQIYQEAEKQTVDLYRVTGTERDLVTVEAAPCELRYPPPRMGQLVHMESTRPDAVYRMRARVMDSQVGEVVRLTVAREGDVEQVQRRKRSRIAARVPVALVMAETGPRRSFKLVTRDLSTSGIRLRFPRPVQLQTSVEITLDLGDKAAPISCPGRVVRCRPRRTGQFDIGIAFLDLTADDEDRIAQKLMRILLHRFKL